ncbi:MAG: LLM class flavin-dependent oxidoreductase [Proteobacteria bacterium]|nr:LLM class flavin-dependent oxidoreductase [Pseudomonadota bacterium]
MKVGLFDHVERADRAPATIFDERLTFAAAADDAGFYALHVAEHHATPLSMTPVPGVYLGALARVTRRMRIGPLVYLLPLYAPLRLIEEICMLDHLSAGRLEVGIGRGVSPYEMHFHKIDHARSRAIFIDAFRCISAGLAGERLTYSGEHFTYANVPLALRPLQDPHPAFWYGSSNAGGAAWAGEEGLQFVTLGPVAMARENIAAFRKALAARGRPAQPKAEFPGGAAVGVLRYVVLADSDAEADRIARPAMAHHLARLNWLRDNHASPEITASLRIPHGADVDACVNDRTLIVGTPARVRAQIIRQHGELGMNYLLAYMFFGTMTLPQALRSLALMRGEVMPALADL